MSQFNVYSGDLTDTSEKATSEADPKTVLSASKDPVGLHGEGVLVAHFNVPRFLDDGETDLAVGTYDLGEEFPAKAFVSGDATLDVTEAEVGAGDVHVQVEGGTAQAAGSLGKSALGAAEFAIGSEVGGLKLQAMVDTGVVTAGAYTVRVPYVISGT